jgi:N-acetylglucosaminyldiphosphoundecaprenol N-acetyl-beta-D-mannosaminyltransferase
MKEVTRPSVRLLEVPIHALTMDQAVAMADKAIANRQRLLIGMVNAAKLVQMRRDEDLRRAVLRADLILADGMSVVWASRFLGQRLPERVTGIDLMYRMLRLSHEKGYRVYCLGAAEEVLAATAARIRADYPSAVLAGTHHGYFAAEEEAKIVAEIRGARPDILLVAMSSPRKEQFLGRWADAMNVPVCHGVGGSFDVLAGKVRRAPPVWQRLGMEWLYRLLQEPGRLWKRYLVTNSLFIGWVVMERLRRHRSAHTAADGVTGGT